MTQYTDQEKDKVVFREYIMVGILHLVFAAFLAIEPVPYFPYAAVMYVIMLIFTVGIGGRVEADTKHFLGVVRSYNRVVIPLVTILLILFGIFEVLFGLLKLPLFDIVAFLSFNLAVLILSFLCPFLFGSLLLSIAKRRKARKSLRHDELEGL